MTETDLYRVYFGVVYQIFDEMLKTFVRIMKYYLQKFGILACFFGITFYVMRSTVFGNLQKVLTGHASLMFPSLNAFLYKISTLRFIRHCNINCEEIMAGQNV